MPRSAPVAMQFIGPINQVMAQHSISTPLRIAAFLAEMAHECGDLLRLRENLNYGAAALVATWPTRFRYRLPGERVNLLVGSDGLAIAESYERQPERIANRVYANRLGNGSEATGHGWAYRGGGGIQVTGRDNYRAASIAIAGDADTLLLNPELVAAPAYAMATAGWFWSLRALNQWADRGDIQGCTTRINGGRIGATERAANYARILGMFDRYNKEA